MRLKSFEVEGFRNIGRRLRLENLQRINLIHGENNVGKSNVLHAIRLLFALPGLTGGLEEGESQLLTNDDFVGLGFKRGARDIFGLDTPERSIFLGGVVGLEGEDLKRAPLYGLGEVEEFYIGYELTLRGAETLCKLIQEGKKPGLEEASLDKKRLERLRAWIGGEPGRPSFDWLDTQRLRESSSSHLASIYFDFRDSDLVDEQQIYKRFEQEMVRHFRGLIGEGEIKFLREKVPVVSGSEPVGIQQVEERKHFSFAPPGKNPIPFHLLGTGVQQLFMFMGHLLASKAAIVGIEEPEMNLRYTNQRKLGEILKDMIGKPGAPSQIFMTSHSPAFEQGEHFYLMEKGAEGPTVRCRPIREAKRVLGMMDNDQLPSSSEADPCYVSTEGVTIVPKDVMELIGIPDGGGIMYLEMNPDMCAAVKGNIMRVLSDEDFVKEFGISDDGEPGDGD